MLFETEGREVNTGAEDLGLGQNTDTANTVNLHFHVWVAIGIAQVGQVGPPGGVLCITFDNNGIFVKSIGEGKSRLGLLPRVQIVGLFTTKPIGEWSPNVCFWSVKVFRIMQYISSY